MVETIRQVHKEPRKDTYGSPRMVKELQARGLRCCENTVAKVMQSAGIRAKSAARWVRTTDSDHSLPVAENVLDRQFKATEPNAAWVGDITYIQTAAGWVYLALVVDLFSRRIVGWSMATTMTSRLVVDAFLMGCCHRGVSGPKLMHTDRGSQYASGHFQEVLRERGVVCSMSRKGNCWDNAVAESTFSRLKCELTSRCHYRTALEAMTSVFEYIEVFWNRVRRHSSLGYVAPAEYEAAYNPDTR